MKVKVLCTACINENAALPISEKRDIIPWVTIPLQESKIYSFKCEKGHSCKVIVSGLKHEVLFESGVLALKDGYFREAVTSFAASLERFYEFIILVLLMKEAKSNKIGFDKVWKSVVNQSERQLGAVNFLFFKEFGKAMPTLDDLKISKNDLGGKTPVEFRNGIIHKGLIPTSASAINYGQAVTDHIVQIITEVATTREDLLLDALRYIQANDFAELGEEQPHFMTNAFFLSTLSIFHSFDMTDLVTARTQRLTDYIVRVNNNGMR
ncbi:hypothetical protein [Hymenobacter sedentarius]|uniref:hypothetical protein n=1 Tax=Hymenobacter sedentarius TaxID=1411621 RepID=UPI000A7B3002|nr:hypothetical protein [Hymenobacter sedentarius]